MSIAAALPLTTARLRLREPREEDLEALYEVYTHPLVAPWIGSHTRAEVAAELRFQVDHQREHGWSFFSLEEIESGRFIGDCGLQPLELLGPEIELGYALHPDVWGRGYATEAAAAALDLGLGALGLERVVAVVKPDHAVSRRVLEKIGFAPAGERLAYGGKLLLYEAHPAA